MALQLSLAFFDSPRMDPIKDGTVVPEGIDLDIVCFPPGGTLFVRNLKYDEFDISEMSISETLLAKERRIGARWDWSSLPVFLGRGHGWTNLYVNVDSGIESLGDLRGKKIGVPDYVMTAALWMRVTLKDLYEIEAKDNTWYNGRMAEISEGGPLGLDQNGPAGVDLRWIDEDRRLDVMLDRGELDAAFGFPPSPVASPDFAVLDRYGGTPIVGNPRILKLLPDGGKEIITRFYQQTKVFHANHHIIVQNRVLREHPWVALELYKTFQRSKEVAFQRARRQQSAYLYFPGTDLQDQAKVFGEDPYPLGVRAMKATIERVVQGSLEQGLITQPVSVEDLYFPTTHDT